MGRHQEIMKELKDRSQDLFWKLRFQFIPVPNRPYNS